jgi:L-lysine exporter family protein LysE/ArgO
MHFLIFGILLGLGAAIPIGPVNLEIIRRNLQIGTAFGVMTGLGACLADLTYLILLCIGALTLFEYPMVLKIVGIVGSFVLAWFGYSAFKNAAKEKSMTYLQPNLMKYFLDGYLITLINPFTILFWASVSTQITLLAIKNNHAIWLAGFGVMLGTISWVLFLNTFVHFTRHRLNAAIIKWFNYLGGATLIFFALQGLIKALIL